MAVLAVIVFLLSVNDGISEYPPSSGKTLDVYNNNCIGFIGIYLMHNGVCYPNGSLIFDNNIWLPTPLMCVLPGSTLDDGQWIGPNGAIPCPGSNSNLYCIVGLGANLMQCSHTSWSLSWSSWWWLVYKCCLPTNCSDPNTNIIFVNIFSKCMLSLH